MENVSWTCKSFYVERFHIYCNCFDYCSFLFLLFAVFLERFGPLYIAPHKKQDMRKNNVPAQVDASKMCPLEMFYDADVHEVVANLRKLDGDIPVHPQYGTPVNFFAPQKSRKFWTKPSTAELGYFSSYF